jgi:hypothetical protein
VYSSKIYIFLYFLSFFTASMAYSFLVSAVFSRAKSASILGTFAFFMGYFVYIGLEGAGDVGRSDLMMACLHPAAAFTYGTLAFMVRSTGIEMPACLPVCLSLSVSVCLCLSLSVCLCLSLLCLSVCLPVCLSLRCLPVCLPVCMSLCLPVCLS